MRILLVEDDVLLGDGLQIGLTQEGNAVDWLKDGKIADHILQKEKFDAIILDLGLPGLPGLELLKNLRHGGNDTPVLILTAKDSIEDRVKGLDLGADDYLTKPFDLEEVLARLRALTRRAAGRSAPTFKHGNLELDPASHTVIFNQEEIKLSRREFALLHTLLQHEGKVISRTQMIESLYNWDEEIDSNALEVHIHHLRKKFGNDLIQTVRGVGYIVKKSS